MVRGWMSSLGGLISVKKEFVDSEQSLTGRGACGEAISSDKEGNRGVFEEAFSDLTLGAYVIFVGSNFHQSQKDIPWGLNGVVDGIGGGKGRGGWE